MSIPNSYLEKQFVGFPYLRIETPLLNYLIVTHIMNDLHDGVCMRNIPYVKWRQDLFSRAKIFTALCNRFDETNSNPVAWSMPPNRWQAHPRWILYFWSFSKIIICCSAVTEQTDWDDSSLQDFFFRHNSFNALVRQYAMQQHP